MPREGRGTRAARIAALAALAATLSTAPAVASPCPLEDSAASAATPEQLSDALACLVNRERRRHGLRKLDVSFRLGTAALRHAQDMRDQRYFSHDSIDGRTFVDRIRSAGYLDGREDRQWAVGETLAWGSEPASQPAKLFEALLDSPPHRRVILDDPYREVGIGVVHGTPEGAPDGATVVMEFGSLISPAALREESPAELRVEAAGDNPRVKGRKQRGKGKPAKPPKAAGANASSTKSWEIRLSAAWYWSRPVA